MSYSAPTKQMQFLLDHVVGMSDVASLPGYEDATPDIVAVSYTHLTLPTICSV